MIFVKRACLWPQENIDPTLPESNQLNLILNMIKVISNVLLTLATPNLSPKLCPQKT